MIIKIPTNKMFQLRLEFKKFGNKILSKTQFRRIFIKWLINYKCWLIPHVNEPHNKSLKNINIQRKNEKKVVITAVGCSEHTQFRNHSGFADKIINYEYGFFFEKKKWAALQSAAATHL